MKPNFAALDSAIFSGFETFPQLKIPVTKMFRPKPLPPLLVSRVTEKQYRTASETATEARKELAIAIQVSERV